MNKSFAPCFISCQIVLVSGEQNNAELVIHPDWPHMKKWISILFLFTLLVQAVPVLHFFAGEKTVVYAAVDEDKWDDTQLTKEKKAKQESFHNFYASSIEKSHTVYFVQRHACRLPSPYLESSIHPPDGAC